MPCFNEAATLETIVDRVADAPIHLRKEILLVDDGSTDGSPDIARRLGTKYFANVLYDTQLSDQSTGYKAFTREVADRLQLTSDGFEICAEITARVRALGYSIREVPVAYRPRTIREGKKIRAVDGWRVVRTLIAYRWPRSARRARR